MSNDRQLSVHKGSENLCFINQYPTISYNCPDLYIARYDTNDSIIDSTTCLEQLLLT